MTHGNRSAFVRRMTPDDISAIVDLQSRVFAGMSPWSRDSLARHLTIFPEGQLVAVDESGRVLGSASSLIIDWDDYAELAKWSVITGDGTFDTHNPSARLCTVLILAWSRSHAGRPSFRKTIADESPQFLIFFEDGFTPPAQLIGSGGVKRRITPAREGVSSQFPPRWILLVEAPWRWRRSSGRPPS